MAARSEVESPSPTSGNRLVGRQPDRYLNRSSPPTNTTPSSRSLENWGWSDIIKDWSEREVSLLTSGWRSSTLTAYKLAWKRWCTCCIQNGIDFKKPSGTQLAKFLANLKLKEDLSPSSVALHKSAISTLANPEMEHRLSEHKLVKQVMKGIVNTSNRKAQAQIWDPRQVFTWLRINVPDPLTLFEVSRRCAIILLLASGRRVHDLTLLRYSSESFIDNGDHIIMWPAYGSKTDSATHQQSGWRLNTASDRGIDPIFWLRQLCILSEQRRKEAQDTQSLFVSTLGKPKPASRTVIGGWVKTVLRDAGINSSAGSTRSAVASLSWLERCPIEKILERGNWKSENTFAKYYKKPVEQANENRSREPSLTEYFQSL